MSRERDASSSYARKALAAAVFGAVFGFLLSWGQLTSPDRIREMLVLDDPYIFVMMGTTIAVSFVALRLIRRRGTRGLLTGTPISWTVEAPTRAHVAGGALFGLGWAISDACPGPVAAQLGQGFTWGLATAAGIFIGIEVYLRRSESAEDPQIAPASQDRREPA